MRLAVRVSPLFLEKVLSLFCVEPTSSSFWFSTEWIPEGFLGGE